MAPTILASLRFTIGYLTKDGWLLGGLTESIYAQNDANRFDCAVLVGNEGQCQVRPGRAVPVGVGKTGAALTLAPQTAVGDTRPQRSACQGYPVTD